jgi:hypothetical protein
MRHPQSDKDFRGFTIYFSDFQSAILSKKSPINTINPPIAAEINSQNSEDKSRNFMVIYSVFSGIAVIMFIVIDWFILRRK